MSDVFISYASPDEGYAKDLFDMLKTNGVDAWYAPSSIAYGESFSQQIGSALSLPMEYEGRMELVSRARSAQALLLVLSRHAMASKWVPREVCLAIDEGIPILALQIDNFPLDSSFKFLLQQVQITPAYHLDGDAKASVLEFVGEHVSSRAPRNPAVHRRISLRDRYIRNHQRRSVLRRRRNVGRCAFREPLPSRPSSERV